MPRSLSSNFRYSKSKPGTLVRKNSSRRRMRRGIGPGRMLTDPIRSVTVSGLPAGLPDMIRTKLHYRFAPVYIQNGYATLTQAIKIKLNSINDPEYATGGAQPPLTDTYGAIYSKYRVNSATVTARFDNGGNVAAGVLVAMHEPGTNTPTFPDNPTNYDIEALPKWQRSALKFCAANIEPGVIELKKTFYPKHFVSQNYDTSVNYAAAFGSDPASMIIGQFLIMQRQGSLTADWGGVVNIAVEYDVTIFDRAEAFICEYD